MRSRQGFGKRGAIIVAIVGNLRTSLNQAGLTGTLISAADENSPDAALSAWNGYSST
jgi:galactan endo-1,6-beta-galactosidase